MQAALAQSQSVLHLTAISEATSSTAGTQCQPQTFTCLAWLIKGLYMAGHTAAYDLAMLPLRFLSTMNASAAQVAQHHSPHGSPARNDTVSAAGTDAASNESRGPGSDATTSNSMIIESASIAAAAAVYEVVPAEQHSILSLSKDLAHAKVKPLWQQRFFTQILQQLQQSLDGANTAASQMEVDSDDAADTNFKTADQQGKHSRKQGLQQEHLLITLAHLIKGAPPDIVKTALPGLVGLLLRALNLLQQTTHTTDASLLLAVLLTVEGVLRDAAGIRYAFVVSHPLSCLLKVWHVCIPCSK